MRGTTTALALAASAAWAVLVAGRRGWWRADVDDAHAHRLAAPPQGWPEVVAVVPARDEAETVGRCVASLLAQDYPGPFRVVLVDDRSTDGTADLARAAARGDSRLAVVTGGARPPGWTGKLNALRGGLASAARAPRYWWFADADVAHAPDTLRALVARAESGEGGHVLVSLMARLRCASRAERWLVPAFVHFFAMLYPFRASNDPRSRVAAAAGGCALVRADALAAAGGLAAISGEIIDDCALARLLKPHGRTWLGLTERSVSLRPYPRLADLRAMVARTAYAQLGHSPAVLAGTVAGLGLVFLAPPALALFAHRPLPRALGAAAWLAMAATAAPMHRRYGLSPLRGAGLPGVAALYLAFTLDSAWRHHHGRGGWWKGEAQGLGSGVTEPPRLA